MCWRRPSDQPPPPSGKHPHCNYFRIADSSWLRTRLGHTHEELRAAGAAGLLPSDPQAAVEILETRSERYGIDELIVPGELAAAFAPVLARFHEGADR